MSINSDKADGFFSHSRTGRILTAWISVCAEMTLPLRFCETSIMLLPLGGRSIIGSFEKQTGVGDFSGHGCGRSAQGAHQVNHAAFAHPAVEVAVGG
jgi:hypothetical protein